MRRSTMRRRGLPDWREDARPVLAIAEDGHLAILTDLQSDTIL